MHLGRGISERLALHEAHDHVEGPHGLVVGQDVPGIADHHLPKVAHLAGVPGDLVAHLPDAPRRCRVLFCAPPLQMVDEVLCRRVRNDHVQLAVVEHDLWRERGRELIDVKLFAILVE